MRTNTVVEIVVASAPEQSWNGITTEFQPYVDKADAEKKGKDLAGWINNNCEGYFADALLKELRRLNA